MKIKNLQDIVIHGVAAEYVPIGNLYRWSSGDWKILAWYSGDDVGFAYSFFNNAYEAVYKKYDTIPELERAIFMLYAKELTSHLHYIEEKLKTVCHDIDY